MANKTKTYKAKDLTISINRADCISCSSCVFLAPKTFKLDDSMISTVPEDSSFDDEKTIREAAASCPTSAITVEK